MSFFFWKGEAHVRIDRCMAGKVGVGYARFRILDTDPRFLEIAEIMQEGRGGDPSKKETNKQGKKTRLCILLGFVWVIEKVA